MASGDLEYSPHVWYMKHFFPYFLELDSPGHVFVLNRKKDIHYISAEI